jgi:glycosyltransferase involved in cell wall biosynthesis
VLYVCIPVYNEAPTIGVLLWRIRKVFQQYSREYEIVVHDGGSSDATLETLEPYTKVLPLTVIGGQRRVGYAGSVSALCQGVARRTKYPRRDAMVLMQGDFTDRPEHLPELVKRFEGGADLVVGERSHRAYAPGPARTLRRVAPWVLRPFVAVPGVGDPFSSFRLVRIAVVRDLLRQLGDAPPVTRDGWAGNVELLLGLARHARRIETVELTPRWDVRTRETRVRPWNDAVALYRFGRAARRDAVSGTPRGTVAPNPTIT